MKTFSFLKISVLSFFFFISSFSAMSQYVYIPDSAFRDFLQTHGYGTAFNGDSLDTTSAIVTGATYLNCSGFEIQSIEGIQYFTSLQSLDCSVNYLTTLPQLSDSVVQIECYKNLISSLPSLPANLISLDCYFNHLDFLPSLPPQLENLNCDSNRLHQLPQLPATLKYLVCPDNHLDTLPQLPATLLQMVCGFNQLKYIPQLPAGLNALHIPFNPIQELPLLPAGLKILSVMGDNLDSLPLLPDSLYELIIGYNHISELPPLPPTLRVLFAPGNQLTSLPLLPDSLNVLSFSDNNIDSMPPLPRTIITLQCGGNPIYHLPDTLPPNLFELTCYSNFLTTMPDLPASLRFFACNNNNLHDIPPLSETDSIWAINISDNPIHCLPKFKEVGELDWYNTRINCIPKLLAIHNSYPLIETIPLCQPSSGCEIAWNISGNIYHDLNADCILDTSDRELRNVPVYLDSAGVHIQSCSTNGNGEFAFRAPFGNYVVRVNPTAIPVPFACPPSGMISVQLNAIDSLKDSLDFALTCPNAFDLIARSVSPETMFRPTRLIKVLVNAGDLFSQFGTSCYDDSGYVQCTFSGPVAYVGPAAGALTPLFTPPSTLRWDVPDFAVIDPAKDFNIELQVDSFASLNDQVCFNLATYPFIGDIFPLDNFSHSCYPIRNSIDPNEKFMSPSGSVDTSDHVFNFSIYFQNTGNAPAEDIYILDTLDNDLDISTFEFLSSTHEVITQIFPGNVVRFNYHGINLTDSVTDETLSHGHVNFRVSRKTNTGMGTEITNTAYIYFDQNPALATNMVSATVTSLVGVAQNKNTISSLLIYPNPAQEHLRIMNTEKELSNAEITDLYGKVISNFKVKANENPLIDVSGYTSGVYFISLSNSAGIKTAKFIKQ